MTYGHTDRQADKPTDRQSDRSADGDQRTWQSDNNKTRQNVQSVSQSASQSVSLSVCLSSSLFLDVDSMKCVVLEMPNNVATTCDFDFNDAGEQTNPDLFDCAGDVAGEDSCYRVYGGPLACLDQTDSFYLAAAVSFEDKRGRGDQHAKVKPELASIRAAALPEVL